MSKYFEHQKHEIQGHEIWLRPISGGAMAKAAKGGRDFDTIARIIQSVVCDEDGTLEFDTWEEAAEGMPIELQAEIVKVITDKAEQAMGAINFGDPLPVGSSTSPTGGESRSQRRRRQRQERS